MTRINLVPPAELCDQHLLAEHRELTRIPNAIAKGKYHLTGQPTEYKLGEGHVRFFFNKMAFLKNRYDLLHAECKARGFNVQYIWNEELSQDPALWLDYEPTEAALALNRARIQERMPAKARFTPHRWYLIPQKYFKFLPHFSKWLSSKLSLTQNLTVTIKQNWCFNEIVFDQ